MLNKMKTMDRTNNNNMSGRPVTTWSGSSSCKVDGMKDNKSQFEKKVSSVKEKVFGIVKEGKTASIRCRRHKKRFTVPIEWLNTCSWLCHKCYEKLSSVERKKYAPRNDIKETVKDTSAPIDKPKKIKANTKKRKEEHSSDAKKAPVKPKKDNFGISGNIAALMPPWRMRCKNCLQTVPVHKMWLDNTSKVLCPSCAANMTSNEISLFNFTHPAETAEITKVEETPSQKASLFLEKTLSPIVSTSKVMHDELDKYGRYSDSYIKSASRKELKMAVEKGRLSKARVNIELQRRRNIKYYSMMPETTPIPIMI